MPYTLLFFLQDMLSVINRKGPLLEGIFRKSTCINSCRNLKEKLNSGDRVNCYSKSVHVVACVLKDFLENIEGSLLSSKLYEKWLGVLNEVTEKEKINAAQRLLTQLPKANVVLLRYLFGVLYNIEQQSSSNQMTAYDLSVCIAPSILCPPNTCSLELEDNFIKKASLVQFLIENCLKIFGEDITSLLGENSKSCHNNEKAAGTVNSLIGFRETQTARLPGVMQAFTLGLGYEMPYTLLFFLQDMLSFINEKGPLTEGIFRKPGSIKSCGILKKKLNSGDRVRHYSKSVLVVAFVLKDFLENIEGSLLSSDLYEKWLGVLDEVTQKEKINAAQRLLTQLPKANVVLLRYLFGVLYNIEQQSSSNQMTAYDLSVCIAPSILCPPNTCSLELEDNFIKKVERSLICVPWGLESML
uniref:Rho-GAP domain-containing protein n=1 Tax=Canis lupus familiaris TaxID=9615 RepID=A0A8C0NC90_CANLF